MKRERAERILRAPGRYAHHDRIFLNNPVVAQGMGVAPLVILATSGQNVLMLALAVLLLLTPSRVLASILFYKINDDTVKHSMLVRGIGYCMVTSVVYIAVYFALSRLFGTGLLGLGVYLPLLAVEPLIIYRYARVPETPRKAFSKGIRITFGYALVLLVVGCLRELLAQGTLFGLVVRAEGGILPAAALPAGGFILLGLVCAVWRSAARSYQRFLLREAHDLIEVHRQEEESHD